MVKSIDELKEFIQWAKKEGLQQAKIGECEFIFSAFELSKTISESFSTEEEQETNTRVQHIKDSTDQAKEEDEADLFWSARG